MAMAFGAVTILMDTLHQHFLLPTPRFPLRNKTKIRSLYRNLSSLQTSLERDFKVGECDEGVMKDLEAQIRDACVQLRFQIEYQLTLFYLGRSMRLRLESCKMLLPILSRAIKDRETMDFGRMLGILEKHFTLPVSRMPRRIKKRFMSFCKHHPRFLYGGSKDEQESDDERESDGGQEIKDEQDSDDEQESEDEQDSDGGQGSKDEQESDDEYFEWETEDEQKSDDERGSKYEQESAHEEKSEDEERRYIHMLCEAKSIIRQVLRAPSSYLNKYMKQRIEARHRIRQLFIQGIKLIKKEVLKLKNAYNTTASLREPEPENITVGDSLRHTSMSSAIDMVGCDDEFNMIMDNLNQQSKERQIVSIVGMGGIGKTTLARRVYGDASFISHFDCRAWATISQDYNPTKVFKALLSSLAPGVYEENKEASNNELAELVYKCLKRQRYLIIIDDIWSTDVWRDLQKCFPDDNNQSRMLLTTRLKSVADYAAGSGTNFCHAMRFLNSSESWNLFHNKVLPQIKTLSPEFERIGREIVNKCKGLPLAITVVAGLLSNSKRDLNEWGLIAKNVHTLSLDHSNQQCENIMGLSYTFLPHHLKHCFLSLGCFPEDSELPEDLIVPFWVSEGFLKVLRSKSLEDVARESLQDLVDRNLLMFRERNDGLSKVYQIHDVLHELALREAQKENLLCFNNDFRFEIGFERIQRINSSCISQPWSIQSKICSCNTFLVLDLSDYRHTKQFHFNVKFLRGLLMTGGANVTGYMFPEFMGLLHLRFLAYERDCIFKLHSLPWFMLWNLQTLRVHSETLMDGPLNIWRLPQLKNLHIKGGITLFPPRSVHHNLERIQYLDYRSFTKELFVKIPNLRLLGVNKVPTINLKCEAPNWFESLAYLYKLEELEVCGKLLHPKFSTIHSMGTLSVENFLPNLKKLELFNTKLNWEDQHKIKLGGYVYYWYAV